jgi:hypothetical protein
MKWKSIDANATDDNEVIDLAHCGDCNYTGNKGRWKGFRIETGYMIDLEGIVELGTDDNWGLDDIIPPEMNEEIDGPVTGEAYCPICGSDNFY